MVGVQGATPPGKLFGETLAKQVAIQTGSLPSANEYAGSAESVSQKSGKAHLDVSPKRTCAKPSFLCAIKWLEPLSAVGFFRASQSARVEVKISTPKCACGKNKNLPSEFLDRFT